MRAGRRRIMGLVGVVTGFNYKTSSGVSGAKVQKVSKWKRYVCVVTV